MIIYRTAGAWGPGAGANLTAAQVDGNFYDVSTRVQFLELNGVRPVEIVSFNAVGSQLFIYMSDGSVNGPITLPVVRWFFRGPWQPNTVYARDDVVVAPNNAVYLVTFSHTSSPSFSSGASDGAGHNFYSLLLSVPAATMPTGGARGYVLTKNSDASYNVVWAPIPPPLGGEAGQVLMKFSDDDGDAAWNYQRMDRLHDVSIGATTSLQDGDYLRWSTVRGFWINQPRATLNVVRSTSWDPVRGDENTFMILTNGTVETSVTIPHDDTQNFPVGSELHIHQDGIGTVTVDGEDGVIILKHASFSNQLMGQYATATVKKTGSNEWRLFGLLAGA